MLLYQEKAVEGLLRSSRCLAVLGHGLGIQSILLETLRRVLAGGGGADARHAARLTFVLNTSQEEADFLLRQAQTQKKWTTYASRFILVNSDIGVEERAEMFAKGGVFLVNARLLIPDLLAGRVVAEAVDGIIVNHAHSVRELSADAFVLQIFHRGNKHGFIWALSDRPDEFPQGTAGILNLMQRCFVDNLELWPRIRSEVKDCLQSSMQPNVSQRTLALPPRVRDIQTRVLNILEGTLDELRTDPKLNLSHLAVHDSLFHSFEAEFRQALNPMWKSLGPRTQRLVQDLVGARQLLASLLSCDAVEFHSLLEAIYTVDDERDVPAWLYGPDAQALLDHSKSRVYEVVPNFTSEAAASGSALSFNLKRTLEPHAKWAALLDVVESTVQQVAAANQVPNIPEKHSPVAVASCYQVPSRGDAHQGNRAASASQEVNSDDDFEIVSVTQVKKARLSDDASSTWAGPTFNSLEESQAEAQILEPRILIVMPDDKGKRQISSVLHRGPNATMLDNLHMHLRDMRSRSYGSRQRNSGDPVTRSRPGLRKSGEAALLAREAQAVASELDQIVPSSILQLRKLSCGRPCHPRVDVVAADSPDGNLEVQLSETRPHSVILFEPCLRTIRILEVFCAESGESELAMGHVLKTEPGLENTDKACQTRSLDECGARRNTSLNVYLLVFEDSVEKYKFQQSLVRESEAVEALILARRHHTVNMDSGTHTRPNQEPSARQGGGSRRFEDMVQQKVIVDMREFRSALPFMLYQQDLTIEPVTIPVGDYILSRDICIERKALPDLVQSLASGRLYQQAQNMCLHYANPSLLIEFDPSKSFALQNSFTIAKREVEVSTKDLLGKLALLVLHFPKLRLIWSPSQRFTADIFHKLKRGRHQPDPQAAASINNPEEEQGGTSSGNIPKTNSAAFDVLRKLPGITPKNMYAVARKAGTLAGLAALSEDSLAELMGQAGAKQLVEFLKKDAITHKVFGHDVQAAAMR